MFFDEIRLWLERRRETIYELYLAAGTDSRRYPTFASLAPEQLAAILRREVRGMISFHCSDHEQLAQATRRHRKQAASFLGEVPLEEQLRFLDQRREIVDRLLEEDPETEPFRAEFRQRQEEALRFYRVKSRAIEMDQRLTNLADSED